MSEYGFFDPGNKCGTCGAGAHNNYEHDEDCLINVPVAFMQHWRDGYAMRSMSPAYGPEADESRRAYVMGLNMKETQLLKARASSERTVQSLQQAIDIIKERAASPAT